MSSKRTRYRGSRGVSKTWIVFSRQRGDKHVCMKNRCGIFVTEIRTADHASTGTTMEPPVEPPDGDVFLLGTETAVVTRNKNTSRRFLIVLLFFLIFFSFLFFLCMCVCVCFLAAMALGGSASIGRLYGTAVRLLVVPQCQHLAHQVGLGVARGKSAVGFTYLYALIVFFCFLFCFIPSTLFIYYLCSIYPARRKSRRFGVTLL